MGSKGKPAQKVIDPFSLASLLLKCYWKGRVFSTATGFIVKHYNRAFLFTNWHVLSGRDPDTDKFILPGGIEPDEIGIMHHVSGLRGEWEERREILRDAEGNTKWVAHPDGRKVDVAALFLQNIDDKIDIVGIDPEKGRGNILIMPSMPVSIIGYPMGIPKQHVLPVWKTGHVASDPDIDFEGRPAFLIDATTRAGMSGSPVICRMAGSYLKPDGSVVVSPGATNEFLGVYSSHYPATEIGVVWKPKVIDDIRFRITYILLEAGDIKPEDVGPKCSSLPEGQEQQDE